MKTNYAITSVEVDSEPTPEGRRIPSKSAHEDHVLKLLDEAITEWLCDYGIDDLPPVILSASTLEPIFALLRHNEFRGSLIVAFYDGIPMGMVGRGAEDSFEDAGNNAIRIKA